MTHYLVGRLVNVEPGPYAVAWTLMGIYSDQRRAEARCADARDFVAPVELDQDLALQVAPPAGGYFPTLSFSTPGR